MTGKIAFQGEPGANSQIACQETRPDLTPLPCKTFEDVFAAVEDGAADIAMIPVENSIAGRVADIHHLLPESNLHIIAEHFLPIRFQLMALPGTPLSDVKRARSHVMALGQCRKFLRAHGIERVVAADTAGAARMIAEAKDRSEAAIAPRLAAEIYGLEILAENIEDAAHNTTRFVLMSIDPLDSIDATGPCVTSFVFRTRNLPASLYKALGGFATNGVNMTKLESYQVEGTFNATQFYAEIEGHPDQTPVQLALEELGFFSSFLRILGVYPAHPFRRLHA